MRWSGPEAVAAAIVFAAIGAGYRFPVLATSSLATLALAYALSPFLVVIAGTRVRPGPTAVGAAAGGMGFQPRIARGLARLLVPCAYAAGSRPASSPRRTAGCRRGLIPLAVPFVRVAGALAIRQSRTRA